MRLTKWAHACVQIEVGPASVVIDPGTFVPNGKVLLAEADVVLITHDHFDHFDVEAVAAALQDRIGLHLLGPHSVVRALRAVGVPESQTSVVDADAELEVGGVAVRTFVGEHATIHEGIPVPGNVGFLIADAVFHPGDSYRLPPFSVETLLVPISGPWVKTGEAIDFINSVAPQRTIAVHEAMLSEIGWMSAGRFLGEDGLTGIPMLMLATGESIEP